MPRDPTGACVDGARDANVPMTMSGHAGRALSRPSRKGSRPLYFISIGRGGDACREGDTARAEGSTSVRKDTNCDVEMTLARQRHTSRSNAARERRQRLVLPPDRHAATARAK